MSRPVLLVAFSGMLAMADLVIALFFLKFHARTRDRLFALFALAFTLLAIQRFAIPVAGEWAEDSMWLYGLRLVAFLLIIAAIVDKNRGRS